jgi:hypothetical protein
LYNTNTNNFHDNYGSGKGCSKSEDESTNIAKENALCDAIKRTKQYFDLYFLFFLFSFFNVKKKFNIFNPSLKKVLFEKHSFINKNDFI